MKFCQPLVYSFPHLRILPLLMNDIKPTPSLVRLKRVHYFLDKDAEFRPKVASSPIKNFEKEVKDGGGGKRNEMIPFAQIVWDVAQGIMDAGHDAAMLDRSGVIAWSKHILNGDPAPVAGAPAPEVPKAEPNRQAPVTDTAAKVADLHVEIPIRTAILTMLIAAHQLSESFDRKPGAEKLRGLIGAAYDDCLASVNAKPVQPA